MLYHKQVKKPFVPKKRTFAFPAVERMGQVAISVENLTHGCVLCLAISLLRRRCRVLHVSARLCENVSLQGACASAVAPCRQKLAQEPAGPRRRRK